MNAKQMIGCKKIHFVIEQDEDGYPPVGSESVWGREDKEGHFIIQNIPFFIKAATFEDVIAATVEDGALQYKATVKPSTNSLLRVVCYRDTDPVEVCAQLEQLGCSTELAAMYSLIAVNVPSEVRLRDIEMMLDHGVKENRWDYEEPLLRQ
jgi:hypothetical protein